MRAIVGVYSRFVSFPCDLFNICFTLKLWNLLWFCCIVQCCTCVLYCVESYCMGRCNDSWFFLCACGDYCLYFVYVVSEIERTWVIVSRPRTLSHVNSRFRILAGLLFLDFELLVPLPSFLCNTFLLDYFGFRKGTFHRILIWFHQRVLREPSFPTRYFYTNRTDIMQPWNLAKNWASYCTTK